MNNEERESKIKTLTERIKREHDNATRRVMFDDLRELIGQRPADFVEQLEAEKGLA